MIKEWKDKWIAALRSGQYKQTMVRLHSTEEEKVNCADGTILCIPAGYCCLGVLADQDSSLRREIFRLRESFDGNSSLLDSDLLNKYGILVEEQTTLIRMNDTEKKSFTEIADYIEAEL